MAPHIQAGYKLIILRHIKPDTLRWVESENLKHASVTEFLKVKSKKFVGFLRSSTEELINVFPSFAAAVVETRKTTSNIKCW